MDNHPLLVRLALFLGRISPFPSRTLFYLVRFDVCARFHDLLFDLAAVLYLYTKSSLRMSPNIMDLTRTWSDE